MTMALARPTAGAVVLRATEVSLHTVLALVAHRVVAAPHTPGITDI